MKRTMLITLSLSSLLSAIPVQAKQEVSDLQNVYRTPEEIKNYIENNASSLDQTNQWIDMPSISSVNPGQVDSNTLVNALRYLNTYRFIAGVNSLPLDSASNQKAQAGAFLMASVKEQSHYPSAPYWSQTDPVLYELAKAGCSGSNIGSEYDSFPRVLDAMIIDFGKSNAERMGHRFSLLHPGSKGAGFGVAANDVCYYAVNMNGFPFTEQNVAWPAQNTPIQYFKNGQSCNGWTLGIYGQSIASVQKVELSDLQTGTVQTFMQGCGMYTVSNASDFFMGNVVFYPEYKPCQAGDSFDVKVYVTKVDGSLDEISYRVNFFDLEDESTWHSARQFEDIDPESYFYDSIDWALKNAITTGKNATHFDPVNTCTRAELVTFLWRMAGCPLMSAIENPFEDIKTSDYYYQPVLWALTNNITTGKDASHFDPMAKCTRAEAIEFIYRACDQFKVQSKFEEENPFEDIKESDYYCEAASWSYDQKVATGKSDGIFAPDDLITRADTVVMLDRFVN